MSACNSRKIFTLIGPILTIIFGAWQLSIFFSWSQEEFKESYCRHSDKYYEDLKLTNSTLAREECEQHVNKAQTMNIIGATTSIISIVFSICATIAVTGFFKNFSHQKLLIIPFCVYHFFMIPIIVFSDMYLNYIPLALMFIAIGFYLAVIAMLFAHLRYVSPNIKKKRSNKKVSKRVAKKTSVEEGKDVHDDFFDDQEGFSYKKMKPAFYSSN